MHEADEPMTQRRAVGARPSRPAARFLIVTALSGAAAAHAGVISSIDLSRPFATRSAWHFTATQGPDVQDPVEMPGDTVPGAIRLCISRDGGKTCEPDLGRIMRQSYLDAIYWGPHFLDRVEIVRPQGGALLVLKTASTHSGDGDQIVATQVLAYDRSTDRFRAIYGKTVGHNRNEEVRYIADGPLKGAMISAEPTENAPYGFWIVVDRLTPAFTYRQVLRYRSATHYGDGNPLAVIDSEMPNIQRRLGLWRRGAPLPLPKEHCPKPRLVATELWCGPPPRP